MNAFESEWSGEMKPAASTKFALALVMEMPVAVDDSG